MFVAPWMNDLLSKKVLEGLIWNKKGLFPLIERVGIGCIGWRWDRRGWGRGSSSSRHQGNPCVLRVWEQVVVGAYGNIVRRNHLQPNTIYFWFVCQHVKLKRKPSISQMSKLMNRPATWIDCENCLKAKTKTRQPMHQHFSEMMNTNFSGLIA